MTVPNTFERGAEWRQWDLHIHSPASFHWKGTRLESNQGSKVNEQLIDEMIAALNAAEPAVYGLMDYWTFEGWFALKRRLTQSGAPQLNKRVFPGIELRLAAPTSCRLNAHVLFSDKVVDQVLHDFKSALQVEIVSRPLSDNSLVALARQVGEDKLRLHGFKKTEVDSDQQRALLAGAMIAEINCESYKSAIDKVPNGQAIGFMPYDTSDGLSEVKWQDHYAYFLGLFNSSPIFETRSIDLRGAFVGEETVGNLKWIKSFQCDLGSPRLAVSGSDAHRFIGESGNNDKRGYGDFPSSKATWVKADPTFLGLLHAIKEPAKRSFIGERPPKLLEVDQNKTYFIERVEVRKNTGSPVHDEWLSNCNLSLNPDLIAIIGNKGSGKSALADVIALLGNSKQKDHFSFLSTKRFRAKPKELAKHFKGQMTWCDQTKSETIALSDDPEPTAVELVRYIPQAHFEKLCNDHVSGRSDVFENELRAVIFDHTSVAIRQRALDFGQLIEQQESSHRDQLGEYRKDLRRLNQEIETIEAQLQPDIRKSLEELLILKKKQIEEHNKIIPKAEPKPSEQLTLEQQQAATMLEGIDVKLRAIEERERSSTTLDAGLTAKTHAVQSLKERLRILQRQYKTFQQETAADLETLGLELSSIATLTLNEGPLEKAVETVSHGRKTLAENAEADATEKQLLLSQQETFNTKLNEPQLRYQQSLKAMESWQEKLRELTGGADVPDTLKGVEARIQQLGQLPATLVDRNASRIQLSGEIFDILEAQRKAREVLFAPVQDVIQSNRLIRDEYKLQFQATLGGSTDALSTALFTLIKQNAGEFKGDDESHAAVKRIAEKLDLSKKPEVLQFASELHDKIVTAANNGNTNSVGITSILRTAKTPSGVNKTSTDVYDLIFGLSFLEPRYSLLFQDTQIEQLSPGQRGALLLIFYLLVDKGRNPIILDQPEENLDNETVVNLLVPVLNEAKKKRQIIMVTHNPNLAVVCDAEQVIYSSFDRKTASKISYVSGSIENPTINLHVVNVLEGTKPAFDNRRSKYH
jgi:ABC-type lipoprotein export system ATPase subunit